MAKSMVVIGSTGTGKSTLCNVLSGKAHDDNSNFPTSEEMESCTNKTTAKEVFWRGDPDFKFTLIDTPGLNDPEPGRDTINIAEMISELKKLRNITLFLIMINGSNPRFDQSLIAMLKLFIDMFGEGFLENNTVFVFSNWSFDKKAIKKRGPKKTEGYWTNELNKQLRTNVLRSANVPALFIDARYDDEDEFEIEKFEDEVGKLDNFLKTWYPYSCEGFTAVKTKLDQAEEENAALLSEKLHMEEQNKKLEKEVLESNVPLEAQGKFDCVICSSFCDLCLIILSFWHHIQILLK